MREHNVNIYFSEKTYNKIKSLITQRKVSKFVNKVVERELKEKLIAAYKRIAKNKKMQSELTL